MHNSITQLVDHLASHGKPGGGGARVNSVDPRLLVVGNTPKSQGWEHPQKSPNLGAYPINAPWPNFPHPTSRAMVAQAARTAQVPPILVHGGPNRHNDDHHDRSIIPMMAEMVIINVMLHDDHHGHHD